MIAVVADDLTGAAELAAMGLRYGLNAEVQTALNSDSKADLVVIDTDTRSRTAREAATEVETVLKQLQEIRPEWIYKKVDSVLRGPVVAELEAVLASLGKDRIMLAPANPSLGRKIRRGHYFVDGQPLDKTGFADDPEHPVSSSDILELLGPSQSATVRVLRHPQPIPAQVIAIAEAQSKGDLLAWAGQLDAQTIPAGAAEFFAAVLETKGFQPRASEDQHESDPGKTRLFVCAGSSDYSHKTLEQAQSRGVPISRMPPELLQTHNLTDKPLQQWADDTIGALEQSSQVVVAISQPITQNPQLAQKLRRCTAALVDKVLNQTIVNELYIEGGTTTSAVVRRLQWTRFSPCCELAPGVVRMRVEQKQQQYLTAKPGSYTWPEKIWTIR